MRKNAKWMLVITVVLGSLLVAAQSEKSEKAGKSDKPAQGAALGRWKLNVQKSDFGKMPPPKSLTVTVSEDTPTALKWHAVGVEGDGKRINETFVGAADGKEYPIKGSPEQASISYSTEGSDIKAVSKMKDGTTVNGDITMSDDKNTMTIKNTASGPKGDMSWTEVFEKAPSGKARANAAPKQ